ncbi:copper chaperone PCu(A)C [Nocardiopsis sp. CT-R113]|uniref:Copper chaperone PCu(A)C n=1 Tax=Nocardiopsis codii TaxID=3065942 RepID=A0ABU7K5A5_9ACTN|nr:copper chaperone PCu(A)C [Nocardiopsis sp. CT-R113]MEE2037426.1 copper chaperone PCu(A)C [Nocardiopsis sp. CT-R113]
MPLERPGAVPLSRTAAPAALSALLLLTACGTGDAPAQVAAEAAPDDPRGRAADGDLEVTGAWVPEPANPGIAVLYLEVSNAADEDTAITGVSTGASPDADLCSTETTGSGASRMRVVDEIPVAAGGATALVDGGYHIMVNDLAEPLEAGDEVAVTLAFAGERELEFTAPVQPMAAGSAPVTDHGGHH